MTNLQTAKLTARQSCNTLQLQIAKPVTFVQNQVFGFKKSKPVLQFGFCFGIYIITFSMYIMQHEKAVYI